MQQADLKDVLMHQATVLAGVAESIVELIRLYKVMRSQDFPFEVQEFD